MSLKTRGYTEITVGFGKKPEEEAQPTSQVGTREESGELVLQASSELALCVVESCMGNVAITAVPAPSD
jgi:hypothetical protein